MKKTLLSSLLAGSLFVACNGDSHKENENSGNEQSKIDHHKMKNQQPEPTDPKETEVWDPEPREVNFLENEIPSDAIVLFDGSNLDAWERVKLGEKADWTLNSDSSMTVKPGSGDIQTKDKFGSIQLHIEWRTPTEIVGDGQDRGNSGVFLQNRYEIQILDSYQNRTYSNGQAGAVYKQHIPLVNATKGPGEWQVYDILFLAPVFDKGGKKIKSGTFTVMHNGVVIQHHVEIKGTTEYIGFPKNDPHGIDVIKLQDHSNLISYRNIWVRKL